MYRHAAAVGVVLCLMPSWVGAQDVVFTVKAESATVHMSPSTGSRVLGRAPRGTVLEVTNELGSWVRVSWPDDSSGAGFVHVSRGSVARHTPAARTGARSSSARPSPEAVPLRPEGERTARVPPARTPVYVARPTHQLGFGGSMGGTTLGFGGTARAWSLRGLGLQLSVSRQAFTSASIPGRVTSIQFAPSALYALRDRMTDHVWLRPYVGAGTTVTRQSFSDPAFGPGFSLSDSGLGFQAFAGSEVTFANAPKLALSVDAGYQRFPTLFAGFGSGRLSLTVAGHWYIR